jgi:hypothetical protein
MTVKLQKRINPVLNSSVNNYTSGSIIKFKNGLEPGSFESTRFIVSHEGAAVECILKDEPYDNIPNRIGSGKLKLVDGDSGTVILDNYGTINYGTGDISIDDLSLIGYPADGVDVRLTATVQDSYLDVTVDKNQIILLDDSTLNSDANRSQGLTVNTIAI